MAIAHQLHLDMAGLGHKAFHEQCAIAKGGHGLGAGALETGLRFIAIVGDHHAAPAAARRRLEQHGIPDAIALAARVRRRGDAIAARHQRHTSRARHGAGLNLVTQRVNRIRLGPTKAMSCRAQRRGRIERSERKP
jgi:hypothetical protein